MVWKNRNMEVSGDILQRDLIYVECSNVMNINIPG